MAGQAFQMIDIYSKIDSEVCPSAITSGVAFAKTEILATAERAIFFNGLIVIVF